MFSILCCNFNLSPNITLIMLPGCDARYSARCLFTQSCEDKDTSHWIICRNYQMLECSCTTIEFIKKSHSEFSFVPNFVCFLGRNMVSMEKDMKNYVHEVNKEKGIDLHEGLKLRLLLLVLILIVLPFNMESNSLSQTKTLSKGPAGCFAERSYPFFCHTFCQKFQHSLLERRTVL
ncbi:hypothetical protein KP509_29G077100 [Ceratopteris richardii]|uniref:Uncharacterized protein n=1 Tax=Ceratopteris richardii TaxID=49495 RepID=A0A8T2R9Y4_CERRI|nr:hypothetical protein KP509_29G077100 [Ceratopteris richardii]